MMSIIIGGSLLVEDVNARAPSHRRGTLKGVPRKYYLSVT